MPKIKTKFGLKLWSSNDGVMRQAESLVRDGIFDYIELLVVPKSNIFEFVNCKVPYIIHVPHDRWGVNIADSTKMRRNQKVLQESLQWANELEAKYIVLHPGFGEIKEAVKFLDGVSDERILIENMPKIGMHNEQMIGVDAEEMRKLTGDRFGFCLDLGHAIKAAVSLKRDYKGYIQELLEMNPVAFHISDGNSQNGKDAHLNMQEGEYDITFLVSCIQKIENAYVTMETPRKNLNSLGEDKENIRKLRSFL